jgi:hypothetical protein
MKKRGSHGDEFLGSFGRNAIEWHCGRLFYSLSESSHIKLTQIYIPWTQGVSFYMQC